MVDSAVVVVLDEMMSLSGTHVKLVKLLHMLNKSSSQIVYEVTS